MLIRKLCALFSLAATLTIIAASNAAAQQLELVVQTGHFSHVSCVIFSPDGKTLASASGDNSIKLWNVETGKEIRTFAGHSNLVNSVAFVPDGKTLASASSDNTVKLWNVETGAEIKILEGHSEYVNSVTFSPDGKTLASTSGDKTIKLWNVEAGKEIKTFAGHSEAVWSVTFTSDGKTLASASSDNTVKLWNVGTGAEIKTLEGHSNWIHSVTFAPDGKTLASASLDCTVKLWNVETGKEIKTLKGHSYWVNSVAFALDGKIVASGSLDKTIKLWSVETGAEIKTLSSHSDSVNFVIFAPDGETLASASSDNTIKLWNIETGAEIKTLTGHSYWVNSVAFSPVGKKLASVSGDKTIKLWNAESSAEIVTLKGHSDSVNVVTFAPDGETLASASRDKTIKLWNEENGAEIKTLGGHSGSAYSVAFAPDGKTLASGNDENTIKLWNVATGEEIKTFTGHSDSVGFVNFAPDGKTLASASWDDTIKLWNVETGKEIKTFTGHSDSVRSVTFSPDGKILASGSWDNTIKLWNVETGAEIKTLAGHSDRVWSVAFSPDGKTLASASDDKTIKLWNAKTGAEIKTFRGHSNWIKSIAFAPNGNRIISGSWDTKTKIWDVKTGKELATLIAVDETDWVVIDPDGRFDASEGALKLMHYSFGLEIINLEQFRDEYFEPGLLSKIMLGQKLRAVVSLKNAKLPPDVVSQSVAPGSAVLKIKLKNRGGGIGETRVLVNGKIVAADARPASLKKNPFVDAAEITVDLKNSAFIAGKENEIIVTAANIIKEINRGNITSRGAKLLWTPDGKEDYQLPTLYAIVGGVSDYAGDRLDLKFAAKDAEDFSAALRLGANRLFCPSQKPDCLGKVNITTLSTSGNDDTVLPTKENFKREFARIAAVAKPTDIVVVYLSGHGVSIDGKDSYLYLTQTAESQTAEDLAKNYQTSAISSDELLCWLTTNQCDANLSLQTADGKPQFGNKALQQVIILDTCAAGTAGKKLTDSRSLTTDQRRAIEFLKDKSGTHILMGSTADAPSYEASKFGQGLLTRALLEGLSGAALDKINGFVDVRTLFAYAEKTVPTLAKNIGGVQKPVVSSPTGKTFVIGQMSSDESKVVGAKLPRERPYVLRPNFVNADDEDNLDTLGINLNLAKLLNDENSPALMRGTTIALIYLDDKTFPGAFIPTGKYTISGETVTVKGALRGDNQRFPFEVTAPKNEIIKKLRQTIRAELGKIKAGSG